MTLRILKQIRKKGKSDVEIIEEKRKVIRPEVNLDYGAYIVDGNGKIIGKSVQGDEITTRLLKFMISISEERKGIAVIHDEKTSVVVPLRYKEKGSGRKAEGVGVFVSYEKDAILNLLNRALSDIKEEANSITEGFVGFDKSVNRILKQIQEITEEEKEIYIGYTFFKYALDKKVTTKLGGAFTVDYFQVGFTLYICDDYDPRVAGWDFDIVINNTVKEKIDEKFSRIFDEVIRLNRRNPEIGLKSLVKQALKNLSPKGEFSKELVEFYVKNNQMEEILEMYNKRLISDEDIPLDLKIRYSSFKVTLKDVVSYIREGGKDSYRLANLFNRISPNNIIEVANTFKGNKEVFTLIKKAINRYLEHKVAMKECSEEKYLALLEFAEEEISEKVIETFLSEPVKDCLRTLRKYGLWSKSYIKKILLNTLKEVETERKV
ncbi:hypothetical protein CW713_00095 [Methanophagales archaeon]|nr:MAG: hypothetical protein CW713_00095 [Methanophagales archaeon]